MSQRMKGVNWHVLAVATVAFGFFLVGLNRAPVPTVDGAVRASMARNIVVEGKLWPITYEGRVFTDHPPLYLWLTALSYKLFGVNDVAANLVPRLAAFLCVIVTAFTALEVGLGPGVALLSALILCFTRDFVLSSVRGYLEPLLELFIYTGLWLTVRQRRSRALWPAVAAGLCVWLAAFTKGPVALWPLLFYAFLLFWSGATPRQRAAALGSYVAALAGCTGIWAAWVSWNDHWQHWGRYLFGQVLSSAFEGRGGAQGMEPLFFAEILAKYYWPWLPFLVGSLYRSIRWLFALNFSSQASYSWMFGVLALGFVGAFSLMKWKFWYYIAPAYPAFALFIATTLHDFVRRWSDRTSFPRRVFYAAAIWVFAGSMLPIQLHLERVPEVLAFKDTIVNSPVPGPVWYVRNPRDHNMIGTSGNWYFHRDVRRVADADEGSWQRDLLRGPVWIITGTSYWASCRQEWCRRSRLIQSVGQSALVYHGF